MAKLRSNFNKFLGNTSESSCLSQTLLSEAAVGKNLKWLHNGNPFN